MTSKAADKLMKSRSLWRLIGFAVCLATVLISLRLFAVASDRGLLAVDGSVASTNTDNAFITVGNGGGYDGIILENDYGDPSLAVGIIGRNIDRFIIDLNGHTLTLAYMAVNMDVEIRGEGMLRIGNGIMIYAGDLYLGDGVKLIAESEIAVMDHGADSRIHMGEGVVISVPEHGIAEIGIQYEYKDAPIIFDGLPSLAGSVAQGAVSGKDYYRILYSGRSELIPDLASAQVAEFPTEDQALQAFQKGMVRVVNPLDKGVDGAEDDDAVFKVIGNRLAVAKSRAILSHVALSIDGSVGINFYFDLSGEGEDIASLGRLCYSGIGEGGSLSLPERGDDGKYKFTVFISPIDMNKTVKVWFDGDASARSWEYSVVKYARYILGSAEFSDTLKDLIASMLNYGAAMQVLNGETDGLANGILKEFESYDDSEEIAEKIRNAVDELSVSDLAYSKVSYTDGAEKPIVFGEVSLAVSDTATLRLYLQERDHSDAECSYQLSYKVTSGGAVYEKNTVLDGKAIAERGYVQISGISSRELDRVFKITVKDAHTGLTETTCEINVLGYAELLYRYSEPGSVNRALAEAIIWYGMAGIAYFK